MEKSKFTITFWTEDRMQECETITADTKAEARAIFERDYVFLAILLIEYKLW